MTPAVAKISLCVDLDGTLVKTNTLIETILGAVRQKPLCLFVIPLWALRGQAYLWAKLVERFRPDASVLPYSEPVLELVRREAASGRPVVLATGAHEGMARDVARHLGVFSGVLATKDSKHLVDGHKADALIGRFGLKGFDYVANSSRDMAAFRICRQAYVVSSSSDIADRLRRESIPAIWIRTGDKLKGLSSLLSAARPKQWVKNILVFVPVLLGHRFRDLTALWYSVVSCVLLSLASSSVYLLNDLIDLEADRRHYAKKYRPLASGRLSIRSAVIAALSLSILAVSLGWLLQPSVSLLLLLYLASAMMYSVWLKRLLIVDVMVLAFFYVFRVYLGAAASQIPISSWTSLFCLFMFSALAAVKRYAELYNRTAQSADTVNRRAYMPEDAMPLLSMGTAGFVGGIVALGLYLGSTDVQGLYRKPDLLWLVCPILLGWSSRLWILANRGELRDEDPVAFVLRDAWSYKAAVASAIIFWLAL
jgi:4-hydroxybenzoate polyprenyltransferase